VVTSIAIGAAVYSLTPGFSRWPPGSSASENVAAGGAFKERRAFMDADVQSRQPARAESTSQPEIDWHKAAASPEFRELVQARRRFVLPATIFFLVWYFGFIVLAGYAPDFMAQKLIGGMTVGYVLALSQFVMTWFLGWLYLRRADRVFDPLAARAAQRAIDTASAPPGSPSGPAEGGEPR
jgi:uncharacterized membrane protein (DUF485 family)